ncbi:MAG: hypothetical protein AUJ74_07885 [Candidatus Omnitrophica bacterium CG1_02_44_16]|nr:MAG: hypothetical protein AUJ74_07885 [Candidatus Omnitrophica bacterium CG1_02_44_16]PIY84035.1 MAG: hypothetical protein COY78_00265 [Candidatus Omnitrophica bacterium CG_4_10_14_0_8_um_filter_44_12]PIZ83999.1 MAG: hypothetical protein COX96_06070 [Candidatus Omnitrophica bacterium CG_4_10_14_0_2_um_filter_44_9]
MMKHRCLLESVSGVLLVSYAVVAAWPMFGLNSRLDKSLLNINKRFSFIRYYAPRSPIAPRRLNNIDAAGVLRAMEELASSCGVRLEYIKLKNEEVLKRMGYKVLPFDLSLAGAEQGIFDFITNIRKLGFLCRVSGMHIKAGAKGDDSLHVQIRLEKIELPDDLSRQGLFDDFLSKPMNRKLFKTTTQEVPKNAHVALGGRLNVAQDLVLVGLIDDDGKKAILEDKKTQKTLFLKKDDTIENLRLIEIRDNEVILSDGTGQFNLTL